LTQIFYQNITVDDEPPYLFGVFRISPLRPESEMRNNDHKTYYINTSDKKYEKGIILSPNYYARINPSNNKNTDGMFLEQDYNDRINYTKNIISILSILLLILLLSDFYTLYKKTKGENEIEKNKCFEEYNGNKCYSVGIDDGPIINSFCMEKLKCMQGSGVIFYAIIIEYFRNIVDNLTKGSYINGIFISIIVILFFNLISKFKFILSKVLKDTSK